MTLLLAKTFSIESKELWFQLRQGYMQEELFRPVFVWGMGLATLLLLVSMMLRDDRMKILAMVLMGAAGLAVLPYERVRAAAAEGEHPRSAPSSKAQRLRQESRWVFLTVGGLALGTAVWGARTRFGGALTVVSLVGGLGATATGIWLAAHDAGAMHFSPRHADTRPAPATEAPPRRLR
ncbi:MAG: hypothetical protein ACKV19_15285 [Verrucomicrobiales bacterium]